jgi:hypothetical protein
MAAFARSFGRAFGLVSCLLCCVAIVLGFWVGGCVDLPRVNAFREDVAGLGRDWAAQSRALEARLAAMKADDPVRPDVQAALARARAKEAAAEAAVEQVDLVVNRAKNPDDPLGQSVGMLSPLLPEPARWPLALGAALVASLVRARQLKQGMASVAVGLDKAMEADPEFASGFRKHANTFRSIQTPVAKRVIDQSQRARRKAA